MDNTYIMYTHNSALYHLMAVNTSKQCTLTLSFNPFMTSPDHINPFPTSRECVKPNVTSLECT